MGPTPPHKGHKWFPYLLNGPPWGDIIYILTHSNINNLYTGKRYVISKVKDYEHLKHYSL